MFLLKNRGAALLMTLACLLLVSIIVVAFLSKASLSSRIAFSSAGQARADWIADTALASVIGDLRNEIRDGSTVVTASNFSVFTPRPMSGNRTNLRAAPSLPASAPDRNLSPALTKVSFLDLPFRPVDPTAYGAISPPVRVVEKVNTETLSVNNRSVSNRRWQRPMLLPSNLTVPSPDWIYVNRAGPVERSANPPGTAAQASDPGSPRYVLGRFAYVVYDIGSLLDANTAGHRTDAAPEDVGWKGSQAWADLSRLGMNATAVDALARWRAAAVLPGADALRTAVERQKSAGNMLFEPGNNAFMSRGDLIRYFTANGLAEFLPQFTVFQRALNQPSFQAATPSDSQGTSSVNYAAEAANAASINAGALVVRVLQPFQREDGSTATVGEPLIKQRFPLQRLARVTWNATADSSSEIYRWFGLSRGSASQPWTYHHGSPSRILTLSEVAALSTPREPDFFELLKAAILRGSLGRDAGGRGYGDGNFEEGPASDTQSEDIATDDQIIRIGAAIIDQYDSDSYPTEISFNGLSMFGIEDLPYLIRAWPITYDQTPAGAVTRQMQGDFRVELWNPHRPSPVQQDRPSAIRIVSSGRGYTWTWSDIGYQQGPLTPYSGSLDINITAASYRSADLAPGTFIGSSANYAGWAFAGIVSPAGVSFTLQYEAPTGGWRPYSEIRRVVETGGGNAVGFNPPPYFICFVGKSDPRTDRFGMTASYQSWMGGDREGPGRPLRWDSGGGIVTMKHFWPRLTAGFSYDTSIGVAYNPPPSKAGFGRSFLADLAVNRTNSRMRYRDFDQMTRGGDSYYAQSGSSEGYMHLPANAENFPVILNRPFRSVAEMGYAFRDQPMKSIDFFTALSADAALLDFFTLSDVPVRSASLTPDFGSAAREPILRAILASAFRRENVALNDTQLSAIVGAIRARLAATGPLGNPSELVTQVMENISISDPAVARNKSQRETIVRALADSLNTRTWNFLIDVVAQSGRLRVGAPSFSDFVVEGERRYWLHVAIDRSTGRIVEQLLEPVHE